jgi:hypothetical protein
VRLELPVGHEELKGLSVALRMGRPGGKGKSDQKKPEHSSHDDHSV